MNQVRIDKQNLGEVKNNEDLRKDIEKLLIKYNVESTSVVLEIYFNILIVNKKSKIKLNTLLAFSRSSIK